MCNQISQWISTDFVKKHRLWRQQPHPNKRHIVAPDSATMVSEESNTT